MRFSLSLVSTLTLLAFSPAYAQPEPGTPPPPAAPGPAQLATDPPVVETETGTDLDSKKPIKDVKGIPFTWSGGEVPPLCLDKLVMGETALATVDIPSCETDIDIKVTKTYHKDGLLMTDYRYKDFLDDDPDITVMYRTIGDVKDGTALEVSSYTGGSGRFTSVVVVKVEGTALHLVHSLGGGDRCNGGVADAEIRNGALVYGFYMTPGDFAMTAYGDDQGLVPYEDLEASAASCFGIGRFEDGKLKEVELLPDALKNADPEWTGRYGLQKCFNGKMAERTNNGKTILSPDEFKEFVSGFLHACKKA